MFMKNFVFLLLTTLFFNSSVNSDEKTALFEEYFVSPDVEYFDCHSSCLIEAAPGSMLAVWKGGPGNGLSNCDIKQDVGIWSSRFENGEWSLPQQIVFSPDSVCWTPVLTKQPNGELLLFYRIGYDPRHTVSFVKRSNDSGMSWSDAEILPAGIIGPTKAKPIFDDEANMICGSSVEVGSPEDDYKATACWIEILSNSGKWSKYGPIEIPETKFGCIEPALFWGNDGVLKLVCRDRSTRIGLEGWIWTAESFDKGKSWTELTPTLLPNPDSGIETLTLSDGKTILIYNNSHTRRYPLTVALTENSGNTWVPLFDLEQESGEFPSAALDSNGSIHIIYAYKPINKTQRRIKHVLIDQKALDLIKKP
jgi:predicted neuraminidase